MIKNNKLISFYILSMTEKPEECKKFEKIIENIMNNGKVPQKELNILLDNPLAFADFMSKYYNDCLKKRENTKKLFSMATLNNDNIKLLTTMNDGFEYIDNLSKEFNDLLSDISTLIGIIINKKIGENQAIIIINGLKKMFEIGSSPPINIERKAQIDNLLQTFMKRNSYNKVVKNPNKQNFKEHIIKEFGLNIHAYYNGMSLLHSLKYVKGEAQKLESSEESINEEEKEKESKIDKDDEELLLALLTYSRYFQTSKNNIKGGYFDLKQTKKNRLKNQQQNINKKKTHKKGGGNSEENKINNILEQEKFKKFFLF